MFAHFKRVGVLTVRIEKKLQTRNAIMDAALGLLEERRSFSSLSLREISRHAGLVPTAFYRHFQNMDELGLALVESTSGTLRKLMRSARRQAGDQDLLVTSSVQAFLLFVRLNRREFGFSVRERFGGSSVIRHAIAREIERFTLDLNEDLINFSLFSRIKSDDIEMISNLVVRTVINAAGEWLEIQDDQTLSQEHFRERLIKQVRLILLGSLAWSPRIP